MGQEGVLSPAPRGLSLICSAQGRACLLLFQMLFPLLEPSLRRKVL